MDLPGIEELLESARHDGRAALFEHECYALLELAGVSRAPEHRLIPASRAPDARDLEELPGDRVALKIVSPDIIHKSDVGGVRIVPRQLEAVREAARVMLDEAPRARAARLEAESQQLPEVLRDLSGQALVDRIRERTVGTLLCRHVSQDATGLGTELLIGLRHSDELGPVLTAGLGGLDVEILAKACRAGMAVVSAPTGLVDGSELLALFRRTIAGQRLEGSLRGRGRLLEDEALRRCFDAFIELAKGLDKAGVRLDELEVNPFVVEEGRLVPLDGVCSFASAVPLAPPRPRYKIGRLLEPRSMAVVGVSDKNRNMGRIILDNTLGAGFDPARLRVIHPGAERIGGVRCVPSVSALPEKVDLLVVAVSADRVAALLDEVVEGDRAESLILIPGGLGETEGSRDRARAVVEGIHRSRKTPSGGAVIVGGNSLGVISHPGRYDTVFIPEAKLPKSRSESPRRTCFISQSGAFVIACLSREPWIDPLFAVSIGNQMDLTVGDLLAFLSEDSRIDVFAVYIEGFRPNDGVVFARAVEAARAAGKDVVVYRAGRTNEGRHATSGHTASVTGDYRLCAGALEIAGALVARDFEEMKDLLRVAVGCRDRRPRGLRLAAMSNAGFESVGMADSVRQGEEALELGPFGPGTSKRLAETLEAHGLAGLVDVRNPLDVTPMASDAAYAELLDELLDDPRVDLAVAGIVPLTPAMQTLAASEEHGESIEDPGSIARRLADVAARHGKPLVAVVDSGALFDPLATEILRGGLPVFRAADRAVGALCRWATSWVGRGLGGT